MVKVKSRLGQNRSQLPQAKAWGNLCEAYATGSLHKLNR